MLKFRQVKTVTHVLTHTRVSIGMWIAASIEPLLDQLVVTASAVRDRIHIEVFY